MTKIFLYSDQVIPANRKIDRRLADVKGDDRKIGYIPSGPDPDGRWFKDRIAYYACYDLELPFSFDLDQTLSAGDIENLFSCNAVHLSGGDTAAFLWRLRRSNMMKVLRAWAELDPVFIGVSAGAIILTPTIATDALFSGGRPEDMRDGDALNLVPFEFFPHFNKNQGYLDELLRYSRHTPRPIAACADGEGLFFRDGKIECFGKPQWIFNGAACDVGEISLR
jgi:dipeptidase E